MSSSGLSHTCYAIVEWDLGTTGALRICTVVCSYRGYITLGPSEALCNVDTQKNIKKEENTKMSKKNRCALVLCYALVSGDDGILGKGGEALL